LFPSDIHQFYDDTRRFGEQVAISLGMGVPVAWDAYVWLQPGRPWDGAGPLPALDWIHQLTAAPPHRFRTGGALRQHLLATVEALARG
jgi:hypothetical protein